MPRKLLFTFLFLFSFLFFQIPNVFALTENFDSYGTGFTDSVTSGVWYNEDPSDLNWEIAQDVSDTPPNSLFCDRGTGGCDAVFRDMYQSVLSETINFSFYTGKVWYVQFGTAVYRAPSSYDQMYRFYVNNDGSVAFLAYGASVNYLADIYDIQAGVWYDVTLEIDYANRRVRGKYVNENGLATGWSDWSYSATTTQPTQYYAYGATVSGGNQDLAFDSINSSNSSLITTNDPTTGFETIYSPLPNAVTSTTTVNFVADFFNGLPALDSTWDICVEAYPSSLYQSPNTITLCQEINASGINTMSTSTVLGLGDYNILWYAYDTVNDVKRFATAYYINVGGYDVGKGFQSLIPVEPTDDGTATSSILAFTKTIFNLPYELLDKFPLSWAFDIYSIFENASGVDQSAEIPSYSIDYAELDLQIWEKLPTATSSIIAQGGTTNLVYFSSSTVNEVASYPAIQTLRTLFEAIIWIGFISWALRELEELIHSYAGANNAST